MQIPDWQSVVAVEVSVRLEAQLDAGQQELPRASDCVKSRLTLRRATAAPKLPPNPLKFTKVGLTVSLTVVSVSCRERLSAQKDVTRRLSHALPAQSDARRHATPHTGAVAPPIASFRSVTAHAHALNLTYVLRVGLLPARPSAARGKGVERGWTPDCVSHRVAIARPGASERDRPPDEYLSRPRRPGYHLVLGCLLVRRRGESEGQRVSGMEPLFGLRDLALRECPAHHDQAALTALSDDVCHPREPCPRRLTASRQQRSVQDGSALLLEPWVGDLHQPMHLGFADDRGGNDVRPIEGGYYSASNMHALWDGAMPGRLLGSTRWMNFADQLSHDVTPAQQASWSQGTATDWAQESYNLVTSSKAQYCVWEPIGGTKRCSPRHGGRTLGERYQREFGDDVVLRWQQAGVRLAELIRTNLGPR